MKRIDDVRQVKSDLLREISKRLSLRGVFRVEAWLQQQIRKNRLHPSWLTKLKEFEEILQSVYPNNWDIYTEVTLYRVKYKSNIETNPYGFMYSGTPKDDYIIDINFNPVIRFESVNITNSRGNSMTINNLFVKIPIENDEFRRKLILNSRTIENIHHPDSQFCLNFKNLQGITTSFTKNMLIKEYMHSHLSTTYSKMEFTSFCLGEGEINQTASYLNSEYEYNLFKLFLFQIETVASWESIEGTPYRYISDINNLSDGIIESNIGSIPEIRCEPYFYNIIFNIIDNKISLTWNKNGNNYTIVIDEAFEKACILKGNNLESYGTNEKEYLFYKDEAGLYYKINSERNPTLNFDKENFIPFRGNKIFFNLTEEITEETEKQLYLHPNIRNYVKSRIEKLVKEQEYKQNYIKWFQTQNNSNQRISGQTEVSVQANS